MATFNTEALALKKFPLGESDVIVSYLSKSKGKIRAVARGARKSGHKFAGLIQPFTYSEITFYQGGSSLLNINHIKHKFSFTQLRNDLNKMAYASYMAELIEKTAMENDPDDFIFSLLLKSFYELSKPSKDNYQIIYFNFNLKFLNRSGFKPELNKCVSCDKDISSRSKVIFSLTDGASLCTKCSTNKNNLLYIRGETREFINKLFSSGINTQKNLHISKKASQELEELIEKFIIYHLDIKLKSKEFLHMIKNMG